MPAYLNFVAVGAARNGTTTHTVDPSSATGVVAGTPFTPTAGRRLVVVVEGSVTSSTPSGWTLPSGGSAINDTGLYVWHRVAAGGDTFSTTHNASNYPVAYAIFEYAASTTFVGSASATGSTATAANPTLSGLTGTNTVIGAAGYGDASAGGAVSATWGSPNVEVLDTNTDDGATDGYWLGLSYQDAYTSATYAPVPAITGFVGGTSERLTFAVNPPSGSATLTPGFISSAEQVFGPSFVPGAVTITPGTISAGSQVFAPSLAQVVAPGFIASTAQVFAPALAPGSVTLLPAHLASAGQFFAPTLQAENTLTPDFIASAGQFFAPTLAPGSITITPGFLVGAEQVFAPVLAGGDAPDIPLRVPTIPTIPTLSTMNR